MRYVRHFSAFRHKIITNEFICGLYQLISHFCIGGLLFYMDITLLSSFTYGCTSVAKPYMRQLCADTGCNLEDLLGAMDDRDG